MSWLPQRKSIEWRARYFQWEGCAFNFQLLNLTLTVLLHTFIRHDFSRPEIKIFWRCMTSDTPSWIASCAIPLAKYTKPQSLNKWHLPWLQPFVTGCPTPKKLAPALLRGVITPTDFMNAHLGAECTCNARTYQILEVNSGSTRDNISQVVFGR